MAVRRQGQKGTNPRILIVTPEITYLPEGMGNLAGKMSAKAGGMADVSASLVCAADIGMHAIRNTAAIHSARMRIILFENTMFPSFPSYLRTPYLAASAILSFIISI